MRISDWSSDVCSSDLLSTPAPPLSTAPHRRGSSALAWLVALLVLAGGGWFGWQWLQVRMQHERSAETRAAQHVSALEQRIAPLHPVQRPHAKRLHPAHPTNPLLPHPPSSHLLLWLTFFPTFLFL